MSVRSRFDGQTRDEMRRFTAGERFLRRHRWVGWIIGMFAAACSASGLVAMIVGGPDTRFAEGALFFFLGGFFAWCLLNPLRWSPIRARRAMGHLGLAALVAVFVLGLIEEEFTENRLALGLFAVLLTLIWAVVVLYCHRRTLTLWHALDRYGY